ncbi:transport permease protein [Streptomyces violascens]|uniref:Transport permease protein n=1 Tax=Streptomyces violascens TaxID=67381 RepID=A0ABQ3QMN9_9ACTN|nr:transport permease protein [Streptomyces violascens]GHI38517.1 transport permease protein [Streptomyces violascens]GHI38540.1 transport permease protein [Streptomyces violascens]GHI39002.1 transport permease protein [Streptomyces violascens]
MSQTAAARETAAPSDASAFIPTQSARYPGDQALSPAELAEKYGLKVSGARPSLPEYVRQLWARRHFITAFATAKLTAQYSEAKLGQIWQLMTPLLNAAVYYFIFGVLMGNKGSTPDYIPWLVTGVFIWTFTANSIMAGTRAITGNIGLVRALHFPRASLPVSLALQQLQQLLFSLAALAIIIMCFGQLPGISWLLLVPALVLQSMFNTGLSLVMARITAKTPDIAQVMPFILRTWMYMSGVMWNLGPQLKKMNPLVGQLLGLNPAAVYIDLVRFSMIRSFHASKLPPHVWAVAGGWAVVALALGFMYFWKAEEQYGRG